MLRTLHRSVFVRRK